MRQIAILALPLLLMMSSAGGAAQERQAMNATRIIWASDPVGPDETVLLVGGKFAPDTTVQVRRLSDESAAKPGKAAPVAPEHWTTLRPLQTSDQSVKFVIPRDWKTGVFACRVTTDGGVSNQVFINAPDIWWMQGDRGETASPGGWLRVFGKCLNFSSYAGKLEAPGSAAMLRSSQRQDLILKAKDASCYSLRFELPAEVKSGAYTVLVHNGFGGAQAWRQAGAITITSPERWRDQVFNVKQLGFAAALKQAQENGGGVIYFPRGRYEMTGQIRLPAHTVLKGEGMDLVNLYWPDMTEPPASLITGKTFAIEDLAIYCQGYYRNVIEDEGDSQGVRLRRVRVRADAFWALGEPGKEVRGRIAVDTVAKTGDAITLHGRNVEVRDCDVLCANKAIALSNASWGIVARNTIHHGTNGVAIEGADRIILENNAIIGSDIAATGNNISSYFRPFSQNVYYAYNRLANAYGYDREFMTFDGSGGVYFGKVAEVDGRRMILAQDPVERSYASGGEPRAPAPNSWAGAAVCILDGKGAGQYRRVVSHDGRAWEIDRPWDIPPDDSSRISIVPFRGHVLFVGNTLVDGGSVQAFGTSLDSIFAGNRGARMSGFIPVWGYNGHDWGWQPSWFCQLLDNEIVVGNEWGGRSALIATLTSWEEDHSYTGPLARGAIIRRNVIHNNGRINIEGVTRDVIVEGCAVRNSDAGIAVAPTTSLVLLRHNTFDNVDAPLSGDGLKHALVIPAGQP